jgi:hypothetical protein
MSYPEKTLQFWKYLFDVKSTGPPRLKTYKTVGKKNINFMPFDLETWDNLPDVISLWLFIPWVLFLSQIHYYLVKKKNRREY